MKITDLFKWNISEKPTLRNSYFIISVVVFSLFFGTNSAFADVTIVLSGGSGVPETSIFYDITGGKLQSIMSDVDANSLIVAINSLDDGSLTLTIPRSVLDATINGGDNDFFVLVDGEEVDFDEITTSTDRTLTIAFPAGVEEIEIIGSFVVSKHSTPTPTPISNNDDLQIVYVIVAIVIVAIVIVAIVIVAIATGVGITLSKRKNATTVKPTPSTKPQTPSPKPQTPAPDTTQFWVCPHCGRDTEYRNKKQFCSSCNAYL